MRIILIDTYSGYIWGDSADYKRRPFTADDVIAINPEANPHSEDDFAVAYAEALDREIGGERRVYAMLGAYAARDGGSGYMAYRVDVDGSEAVSVVQDGQDREMIEAVMRDCRKIGFIAYRDAEHA